MYTELKKGGRASEFENALDWLAQTGLIYKITRTSSAKIQRTTYEEREAFKVFIHDVGLLSAMSGLDMKTFYSPATLVFREFKGSLAEQFILQEIKSLGKTSPVFYWGNAKGKSEVDFVIQYSGEIIPIEVKSDINKKSYSLDVYNDIYRPMHAIRTSLNGLGIKDNLYSIPLYMLASFEDILKI